MRKVADARRHAARHGAFHIVLRELKGTPQWPAIVQMASKSDMVAAMAVRDVTEAALDVLDGSVPTPREQEGGAELAGLLALTALAWERGSTVTREALLKAVDEFEAADERGRSGSELRLTLSSMLDPGLARMRGFSDMVSMMEDILPPGEDEVSVEEAFVSYLRDLDRLSEMMRRSGKLRKIIDIMGQLDVSLGSKQDRPSALATQEMHSLALSSDVLHALPTELSQLRHPMLRLVFMSRMLEGRLLTYQIKGESWNESVGRRRKGPMVALIDASGSMVGEPELIAKALVLMLARKMAREGRDLRVILFAAKDVKFHIDLSDRVEVAKSLMDILLRQFEGGTDFNSALRTGLETVRGEKWLGADILFFTDGMSEVSDQDLVDEWSEFKRRTKSRILTLISGTSTAGGLEKVSDRTWFLRTETPGDGGMVRLVAEEAYLTEPAAE